MSSKTYNRSNFHKYTFCIFTDVASDSVKDIQPNYKSKSGSAYYFTEEGVYRLSNHWGRAANCRWRLDKKFDTGRTKLGFANWNDFHPDNDFQKLYFIAVDFGNQSAHYFHKDSSSYDGKVLLRTSTETAKRIKQIRSLFEDTAWTKYLKEENSNEMQKQIIDKLITTNQTFREIRSEFLK